MICLDFMPKAILFPVVVYCTQRRTSYSDALTDQAMKPVDTTNCAESCRNTISMTIRGEECNPAYSVHRSQCRGFNRS